MQVIKNFWNEHPVLSNWLILAVGFILILTISAWDVGFDPSQWVALIGATVLLAALCAWIISWE
jgi:hypothetical protein